MRTFIGIPVTKDNFEDVKRKLLSKFKDLYPPSLNQHEVILLSIEISIPNEYNDHLTIHPLTEDDIFIKDFKIIFSNIDDIFEDIECYINATKLGIL